MAVFTKALSSTATAVLQGVWSSPTCPNVDLKGSFSVHGFPNHLLGVSSDWHRTGHSFRRSILPVYFASIACDENQTDTVPKETRRRGRPPRRTATGDGAATSKSIAFSKKKPSKKSTEMNSQEMQTVGKTLEGHLFKYPEVVPEVSFLQFENEQEVSSALAEYIAQVSREAVASRGWFTIALSGGSLVKVLTKLAEKPFVDSIDWSKWQVFWVDERVVPLTHSDSNYKLAMDLFLSKVIVPRDQIHAIHYTPQANMVAQRYEAILRKLAKQKILTLDHEQNFPCFDLVLLGIGPDGHIASLFPNSLALAEENQWVVAVLNSPKPPPQRISMTLPCINSASHVAFVVAGSNKGEVLQRILERPALPGSLPAQMVRLSNGILTWFVDKEASFKLSVEAWGNPKSFPFMDFSSPKRTQTT